MKLFTFLFSSPQSTFFWLAPKIGASWAQTAWSEFENPKTKVIFLTLQPEKAEMK